MKKFSRDFVVYRWPRGHEDMMTGMIQYEWGILIEGTRFISCGKGDGAYEEAERLYHGMHNFLDMLERLHVKQPELMARLLKSVDND